MFQKTWTDFKGSNFVRISTFFWGTEPFIHPRCVEMKFQSDSLKNIVQLQLILGSIGGPVVIGVDNMPSPGWNRVN